MKTFLAAALSLLTLVPSTAFAQAQGRDRRGNGGGDRSGGGGRAVPRERVPNNPGGGDRRRGGERQRGGGDDRRAVPRETPREIPRETPRQDGDRSRDRGGWDRGRDRDRGQQPPVVVVPPRDRDQDRGRDRGNWDGDRRGRDRTPPVVVNPPRRDGEDRRGDGGWRRGEERGPDGRTPGRRWGGPIVGNPPRQAIPRARPIIRPDVRRGTRWGVVRPSPRPHDEVRSIYRHMPEIWPESPRGYTRWHRAPRRDHLHLTIGSPYILGRLDWHHRHETHRGRHWWHEHQGMRYSHFCDTWGYHWYGWHVGTHYYWTRWHNDRWWWHDPVRRRWCYWHDNRWWYQDPVNVTIVYVYDDDEDRYYRYDDRQDRVILAPEPPQGAGAPADAAQTVYSVDGSRMVQIVGSERNAYLHDTDDRPSFEPVWLGKNVTEARFRYVAGADGEAEVSQVLVLKSDNSFDLFDGDGYPVAPARQESGTLDGLERDIRD